MVVVRAPIKFDLDRNALHDFHVITGCVLRRQKAEASAAGSGNAVDFAVVLPAVGVDFDGDSLPCLHVPKLSLFEVGCDPDVIQIDPLNYPLAGATFCPTSTV